MISRDLAVQLAAAGMPWAAAPGDRFTITTQGMENDVFFLADMVADLHHFTAGTVVGFNGTTEWALDSVELDHVLWLPREDQLRDALGTTFARLERYEASYVVVINDPREAGATLRIVGTDVEDAYGLALLAVLQAGPELDRWSA